MEGCCFRRFIYEFCNLENFEQRWESVIALIEQRFGKQPDMEGILFLIGINELGDFSDTRKFTKEQKQDLMHIAVCKLLSQKGIFEMEHIDKEGWPHYKKLKDADIPGMEEQEQLLKECIVNYFEA